MTDTNIEDIEKAIEQQHETLVAVAEAVGVDDKDMPDNPAVEAQKAALVNNEQRAEKFAEQADEHGMAEQFVDSQKLIAGIAKTVGVSQRQVKTDLADDDETEAYKQSLVGGR